jgi:hypothetical protein
LIVEHIFIIVKKISENNIINVESTKVVG